MRFILIVWMQLLFMTTTQLSAETFAETNAKALTAFNAGDIEGAEELTLSVVTQGETLGLAEPTAFLEALNNLVFLKTMDGAITQEALDLAERAVGFAQNAQQVQTPGGLLAMSNAARANTVLNRPDRSKVLRKALLSAHRGQDLHGPAVTAAVDLALSLIHI